MDARGAEGCLDVGLRVVWDRLLAAVLREVDHRCQQGPWVGGGPVGKRLVESRPAHGWVASQGGSRTRGLASCGMAGWAAGLCIVADKRLQPGCGWLRTAHVVPELRVEEAVRDQAGVRVLIRLLRA